MRNHLKIISMLYSPHLITEFLLAVELVLTVLLLALSTNSASYLLRQIQLSDSCWGKGQYLYFTVSPSAQSMLDPQEVLDEYSGITEFFMAMPERKSLPAGTEFEKEDGSRPGVMLIRYNSSMISRAGEILDIQENIAPGNSIHICVPPAVAEIYPIGSVLTLSSRSADGSRQNDEYTVCGVVLEEQVPCVGSAASTKTVENLTINVREQADSNILVFIALEKDDVPVTAGMFKIADGVDVDTLAEELNNRFVNSGEFYTYSFIRTASKDMTLWVNKSILLQAFLLSLVFVSHFIGYLVISTRNKERTNALLSINGMSPARLAIYNVCSVFLILIPSVLIGVLLVPLGEKMFPILTAYGGHIVLWECLVIFSIVVLFMVYLTIRTRLKKGNTVLLYRKGT